MVKRYNKWFSNQKNGKRGKKGRRMVFHSFALLSGSCVGGERKAWGGGGIGREGVQVRERWRVGWIEEAERKTTVCGLKEGSDMNHVFFLSPTTCSLLCTWHFDKTCLSDHCTKTKTSYV